MGTVKDNVLRVKERVEAALERSGRSGNRVTIVAVTKTWGPDMVDEVVRAGIEDVGENRLQEFLAKRDRVTEKCRWHLVGHLQRNKAAKAIGAFSCIQSIDSVRIAEALDRLGREHGVCTEALIQVNTSGEASKHGFLPEETVDCAAAIDGLPAVKVEGLMTIGPTSMEARATRECFKTLCRLRDEAARALGRPLPMLSMGMSADFETAVEEGATVLRLGTVLTGPRTA